MKTYLIAIGLIACSWFFAVQAYGAPYPSGIEFWYGMMSMITAIAGIGLALGAVIGRTTK